MRFRWPRSRRRSDLERLDALRHEIALDRREIEADRREIAETKPIVEEAIRRTNARYTAVEEERRRISEALIRDLTEGWTGHG